MDVPVLFGRFLLAPPALAGPAVRPEDPFPPGVLRGPLPSAFPSRPGHGLRQAAGPFSDPPSPLPVTP